jgi:phenylacetate-CoA ligase
MTLYAESASPDAALARAIEATLHESTRLSGQVQLVAPHALPNDGKVIEDRRALPS